MSSWITNIGVFLLFVSVLLWGEVTGLNNGLAATPPLGWTTSERFECNTDCVNYPDDCISESLVRTTVDAMVANGLRDANYKYVIIGDCWMNKTLQQPGGSIQPDPKRFPGGMAALADYVHGRGMRLGLEVELGNTSSYGYPGCSEMYQANVAAFAKWGVDLVQATAYSVDGDRMESAYRAMGQALNDSGRPMVYSCSWAREALAHGSQVDYSQVAAVCNMYTTNKLMLDSWESLEASIKFFGNLGRDVVNHTGPGGWHTANPVLVGDFGLSEHEQHMQMAVWTTMASPLLVSADVRHLEQDQLGLLLNKGTLAVDQDSRYLMGMEVTVMGQVHVWRKAISPEGSFVLLFMYFNISGGPSRLSVTLQDLGLVGAEAYSFQNVLTGRQLGVYRPWYTFDCLVDPVGAVFIKAVPLPPSAEVWGVL